MSEMTNKDKAVEVRQFLHQKDVGVLSTLKDQEGDIFPYGSICPYVVISSGEIVILVSDIALHTKNINRDMNVSFTVFDMDAENKQSAARTSVLAKAVRVTDQDDNHKEISETYFRFNPGSRKFFEVHSFAFYKLKPDFIHYIKGFGKIYKFPASDYSFKDDISLEEYNFAIDHMNKDHQSSITKYLSQIGIESSDAKIISMNSFGFHIEDQSIHYIQFDEQAKTADDLRKNLVALARK